VCGTAGLDTSALDAGIIILYSSARRRSRRAGSCGAVMLRPAIRLMLHSHDPDARHQRRVDAVSEPDGLACSGIFHSRSPRMAPAVSHGRGLLLKSPWLPGGNGHINKLT